jgi:predicted CopG family antitoxin
MATRTISVDVEAYDKLVQARSTPTESFSRVIKRAEWKPHKKNGAALLAAIYNNPPMSEETLDYLEKAKQSDRPPEDKWQ